MGTTSGAMAQLVAHHTGSVGVRGSSPLSSTFSKARSDYWLGRAFVASGGLISAGLLIPRGLVIQVDPGFLAPAVRPPGLLGALVRRVRWIRQLTPRHLIRLRSDWYTSRFERLG